MADQPPINIEATHMVPLMPVSLRLNPTREPDTPPPPRLRLHQVIKSFQGASIHQFILELQQSSTQEGLHSRQQHQEWLAMVQPIYNSCIRAREFLNRTFALYYTLPYTGASLASDPSSLFRFLWNLNIAARHALLPGQQCADPSSHNAIALPLACMNIILASTPLASPSLRKPFSDHTHFPYRTKSGAADTLQCLVAASLPYFSPAFSSSSTTKQQDLAHHIYLAAAKLTQALDAFLAEILAPSGLHPIGIEELYNSNPQNVVEKSLQHQQPSSSSSVAVPASEIPFSGCRLYYGLFDANGQVSEHAMHALNSYIDQIVCPNVEIDERVFLEEEQEEKEEREDLNEGKRREMRVQQQVHELIRLQSQQQGHRKQQEQIQQHHHYQNVQSLGVVFQGHTIHTPPHPIKTRERQHPLPSQITETGAKTVAVGAGSDAAGLGRNRGLSTTEAFHALNWLQNIASTTNIKSICEDLKSFGVSEATLAALATTTSSMLSSVVRPPALSAEFSTLKELTLSLFYCTLNLLLKAEIPSTPASTGTTTNTAALINKIASNPILIQCIMALSLECVVSSTQWPNSHFPASLKMCHNAPPFAVARLLPRFFLAHQTTMPDGLKIHLLSVEERIIEKYAWEEGSSLFDMLREATTPLAVESTFEDDQQLLLQMQPLLPPPRLGSTVTINTSNAAAAGTATRTRATVQAHSLLSAFIDKAVKLVTVRVSHLLFSSTGLLQGQDHTQPTSGATVAAVHHLLLQTVTAVDTILREHTWLMYGRHLDQIMLCALYVLSKNSITGTNQGAISGAASGAGAGQGQGEAEVAAIFSGGFRGLLDAYIRCFGDNDVLYVNTLWIEEYLAGSRQAGGSGAVAGSPPQVPPPPSALRQLQQYSDQQITQPQTQQPTPIHLIQFYNAVFLPETYALLQGIIDGSFPLLPDLPTIPMKQNLPQTAAPTAAAVVLKPTPPASGISPWSQQNTRTSLFTRSNPILSNATTTTTTTQFTEFGILPSPSPSRAMKLSPGRWNVSTAGTRLISATAPIIGTNEEDAWQEEEDLGEEGMGQKRRKRERRRSGTTAVVGTPAKGPCRPVDALLAVAADAEEELRRSTPSSSGGTGSGEQ